MPLSVVMVHLWTEVDKDLGDGCMGHMSIRQNHIYCRIVCVRLSTTSLHLLYLVRPHRRNIHYLSSVPNSASRRTSSVPKACQFSLWWLVCMYNANI